MLCLYSMLIVSYLHLRQTNVVFIQYVLCVVFYIRRKRVLCLFICVCECAVACP